MEAGDRARLMAAGAASSFRRSAHVVGRRMKLNCRVGLTAAFIAAVICSSVMICSAGLGGVPEQALLRAVRAARATRGRPAGEKFLLDVEGAVVDVGEHLRPCQIGQELGPRHRPVVPGSQLLASPLRIAEKPRAVDLVR